MPAIPKPSPLIGIHQLAYATCIRRINHCITPISTPTLVPAMRKYPAEEGISISPNGLVRKAMPSQTSDQPKEVTKIHQPIFVNF